ncbi:polysaccharide biosynthesis/export family protein [Paracoccus sp. MBLB3053]|uniref:Polysaccharide biosynthesis/export family protein n=1 Tax=Paracoccus aurantius TaxID=3073814 RepID=A0ABU2HX97_9RHOB|nr:polysaccharide biosynthesis/export family protein [Paracoccus sp. MBLB3053]MDS9468934.1 polysaccharide biosynthesis/export family protein [Paracoccus sp. MBLB3053]
MKRLGRFVTSFTRFRVVAALLLVFGAACSAAAEPYRLVPGDRLDVAVLGEPERWEVQIDLDGALRLPTLGRVSADGMTLDEAEAALSAAMRETGLYVSPQVAVSVATYAPVLVTGAVRAPGLFDFTPALTANAATAMAGGIALTGLDGTALSLEATQFTGQLRIIETDIQSTLVRIARVEAQLEDRDDFTFDPGPRFSAVKFDAELIEHLMSRERAILTEERQAAAELGRLRQIELDNVEKQIDILMERSKVQDDLIALQQEERDAADALDARGLRTRSDMARVDRMEADLRAQVLDIEAALSQARTRRADIASTIAQAGIDRRMAFLEDSASLRTELERQMHNRRTVLQKSFILGDPLAIALSGEAGPTITHTIHRRRGGSIKTIVAGPEDVMMPGDTLVVEVEVPPKAAQTQADTVDLAGTDG